MTTNELNSVQLLYYTPDYPKLVETVARQCYKSFAKVNESSHNMIRSIMAKGHLSIASVGNIVFSVAHLTPEIMTCLLKMKEINNYFRLSTSTEANARTIVSMNILSLLEYREFNDNNDGSSILITKMLEQVAKVPELYWFINKEITLKPSVNVYTQLPTPKLYNPVLLTEDYTKLKALGFTETELNIHATATVSFMTDRSSGLQFWRHSDMTGGTELSQRYVERGNAEWRPLINFTETQATSECEAVRLQLVDYLGKSLVAYGDLLTGLQACGVHQARAKEIARAILPNAIVTEIIQCRPLKQWLHLFSLRDTVHAQAEIAADVRSLKQLFRENGIEVIK